MAIRTHQSISGFVASEPQLSYTERGDARLYMKVGIEHYRKELDNTFTQLETTFHDLIAYRGAAEQGAERIAKGDNIIVGIPHGICGGCHMKMPTYIFLATKGEQEIVQCINCSRILYYTRDMED